MWVRTLGQADPLEQEMATHTSLSYSASLSDMRCHSRQTGFTGTIIQKKRAWEYPSWHQAIQHSIHSHCTMSTPFEAPVPLQQGEKV